MKMGFSNLYFEKDCLDLGHCTISNKKKAPLSEMVLKRTTIYCLEKTDGPVVF